MIIALTGATGFIGRYIAMHLADQGHRLRLWHRPQSDRWPWEHPGPEPEWIEGDLGNPLSCTALVDGCEAVVHAALYRPDGGFRGREGDLEEFLRCNFTGTIRLIEEARRGGAKRFIFISTCAVHEEILNDRPLDESHPLWPTSHYGAYKAAVEKFVHSYGLGQDYSICALRPTGVYGATRPIEGSKWFDLVATVARGEPVVCQRGGKEVHAADVAKAVGILLTADGIAGQSFNCYDRYVSEFDVATLAKRLGGSSSQISGGPKQPKHQIETGKIRALGMEFGGDTLLERTIGQMLSAASG